VAASGAPDFRATDVYVDGRKLSVTVHDTVGNSTVVIVGDPGALPKLPQSITSTIIPVRDFFSFRQIVVLDAAESAIVQFGVWVVESFIPKDFQFPFARNPSLLERILSRL